MFLTITAVVARSMFHDSQLMYIRMLRVGMSMLQQL